MKVHNFIRESEETHLDAELYIKSQDGKIYKILDTDVEKYGVTIIIEDL